MQAIVSATSSLRGEVRIAGSKNYTSRFLLAAGLAGGASEVVNPAPIDDAFAMADCLGRLGAPVDTADPACWRVQGVAGRVRGPARLNVRNAGAVTRFLMAVCATSPEPIELFTPYPESLGRRPQEDLLEALSSLGASVVSNAGRLPVTVSRGALRAGRVAVSGAKSSQFLSGLLFMAPLLEGTTHIVVRDTLRSRPAVEQTLDVLARAGIAVTADSERREFWVEGPQAYRPGTFTVPGDWPSAAAVLCAVAVTEGDVVVRGLYPDKQGEAGVVGVLQEMGAQVAYLPEQGEVRLRSDGRLRPVCVDGDKMTDAVLALVAAAAFANGTSRFYNLHTLRHKESDRISDFCGELRKCGVDVYEGESEIIVHGRGDGVPGGADIAAHHDHRILMALTIVGLRARLPLTLHDTQHINKSYPEFFAALQALGARIEVRGEEA